jgi:hypothetical protein
MVAWISHTPPVREENHEEDAVYRALGSVLNCLPSAASGNPEEINLFDCDDIYAQQGGDDALRDRVLDLAHTIKECHLSQEEAQAMMMVIGLESLGNIPHLTMHLLSRAVAGSPRVEHVQLQGASEQPLINVTLEDMDVGWTAWTVLNFMYPSPESHCESVAGSRTSGFLEDCLPHRAFLGSTRRGCVWHRQEASSSVWCVLWYHNVNSVSIV